MNSQTSTSKVNVILTTSSDSAEDIAFHSELNKFSEDSKKFKQVTELSPEFIAFKISLSSFIDTHKKKYAMKLLPLLQEKRAIDNLEKVLQIKAQQQKDIKKDAKEFSEYLKKANHGDIKYCLLVGERYQKGNGVAQSRDNAISWYQKGVDKKDIACMDALTSLYLQRREPEELKKAVIILEEAVSFFSPWLENSSSRVKNYDAAIKNASLCTIYTSYANCLMEGLGIEKDFKKAVEFLKKASKLTTYEGLHLKLKQCEDALAAERAVKLTTDTHSAAAVSAGKDNKLPSMEEKEFNRYLERANEGCSKSRLTVAHYYLEGRGVVQSRDNAILWYQKGVEEEDIACMSQLSSLYLEGHDDNEWKKATKILEKAVTMFSVKKYSRNNAVKNHTVEVHNHHLYAMCRRYSRCLREGQGVKKDVSRAILILQKAKKVHDYPDVDMEIAECTVLLTAEANAKTNAKLNAKPFADTNTAAAVPTKQQTEEQQQKTSQVIVNLPPAVITSVETKKTHQPVKRYVSIINWGDENGTEMTDEDYKRPCEKFPDLIMPKEQVEEEERKQTEEKQKTITPSQAATAVPLTLSPQTPKNAWKQRQESAKQQNTPSTQTAATSAPTKKSEEWQRSRRRHKNYFYSYAATEPQRHSSQSQPAVLPKPISF